MAGVKENTLTNISSGNVASFKSVGSVPLKSLKVNFNPIQEGDGDPSPSNIRPITGWTKLDIFHSNSKNILDPFNNPIWQNSGVYSVNQSGEVTVTGSDGRGWTNTQINPLNLKKGTYTISYTGGGNCNLRTGIDDYNTNYSTTSGHLTFTLIRDTGIKFKFSEKTYPATFNVQIEPGFINHSYELYKSFTTIPVSWESVGEVYGGYIDLIKGEIWQVWKKVKIAELTWSNYSAKTHYYANITNNNSSLYGREPNSYIYIDTLTPKTDGRFSKENVGELTYYGEGTTYANYYNHIWTKLPEAMEKVEANEWIAENYPDATICYKLAAPILIDTIDPITINSLIGQNNIWSTADTVEAEYYFLESLDVYKQRFKTNEPHLESSIGNIANFTTDMVSPLKSVKLNFSPLQEGSGDPSPDNIRPISGHNSINIIKTGKNLAEFSDSKGPFTNYYNGGNGWLAGEYWKIPDQTKTYTYSLYLDNRNATNESNAAIWFRNKDNDAYAGIAVGTLVEAGEEGWSTITFGNNLTRFYAELGISLKAGCVATKGMLELGNARTEYEPYNGSTTSITLPETIYGGYIDAVQGKLVVEWGGMRKKLSEASYRHDSTGIARYSFNNCIPYGQIINTSRQICNVAKYSWSLEDKLANHFYGYYTSSVEQNRLLLFLLDDHGLSDDTYVEFAAPFSTPVEFDIDPITLKTLKGTNNIWTNSNDTTEVKYWTH